MARARPSSAMMARRLACALVRTASVTTSEMVVDGGGPPFMRSFKASGGTCGGLAQSAELGAHLAGCGPEVRPVSDGRRAHRVDDHDGADRESGRRDGAGRADPAFEGGGGGAVAAAGRAEIEAAAACGVRRLPAELPVGRHPAPALVAAVQQIEGGGLHGDGDVDAADAKPRPCCRKYAIAPPAASRPNTEPPDSTTASIPATVISGSSNAVSRAPGPPPRVTAEATLALSKTIDGYAGGDAGILRVADANSGQVGDEVVERLHANLDCRGRPFRYREAALIPL